MIKTVDNFISGYPESSRYFFSYDSKDRVYFDKNLEINIEEYLKHKNNHIFHFLKDEENIVKKNESEILISAKRKFDSELKYVFQTGNYVGNFFWDGLKISINSRFSEAFLKRMLNFANDIFLDDVDVSGDNSNNSSTDISKFVLYYLFVQSLESAYLLGLPKCYQATEAHEMKVKGKININAFLRKDIPFLGKVSSTMREQKETQEIIDVIYQALKIIEVTTKSGNKPSPFLNNVLHINRHLKEKRSKENFTSKTINEAIKSKSLLNPLFAPYKKVLNYAKLIIHNHQIENDEKGDKKYYGFIINVAELFEIYISKLLSKEFKDWKVESPKIPLYENNFFKRKIIPDIVMTNDINVIVLDTKYKRMEMNRRSQNGMGDVDQSDFFQINTYMSYYNNHAYNVIAGGLIYPMDKFNHSQCYASEWLGQKNSKFIIDGIDFSEIENNNFHEIEKSFTNRINDLIYPPQVY